MAKLTFYGATEGVTGSAYLLETGTSTILMECGLIQGSREAEKANTDPFPYDIDRLDAVVLSHAHLDHSGRLPRLMAAGYQGPIYMTHPTYDLLEIMLRDAAFLAMRDAQWENKHRHQSKNGEVEPLYTLADVETTLGKCIGLAYGHRQQVANGFEVCYRDAGHILGSAIVELFITEGEEQKKLVFSGDLGNSNAALLRDPAIIETADILLLESTYGDRNHRPMKETLEEFEDILAEATESGGNVLIPSFAVGRTQEIIFRLGEMYHQGKLSNQAVYLDSPMAIAATEVYLRYQGMFDSDDIELMKESKADSLRNFLPVLRYSRTTEDSMALNKIAGGAIIIAGSGMCNGGRIRHHFRYNLWRRNAHVAIVGFQAAGTPGRSLVDGAKTFHLGDQEIAVHAHIHTLGGFSAHASQSQLREWVNHFKSPRPRLFLVHGEPEAKVALREHLSRDGWSPQIPVQGEKITF